MKLFSISAGIIVISIVVVGLIYFFQSRNQISLSRYREETEVNSVIKPGEYINNEYKFSISFPASTKTYLASCEDFENGKNGVMSTKVFEDTKNKMVYIANTETVKVKNKEDASGDFGYDWSTCKKVPTTLPLIKSGYSNGLPGEYDNKSYPVAFKYGYGKINNDIGLVEMGEKILGMKDCQIASKKYIKGTKNTYEIRLRGQGTAGEPEGSCWINADYQFLYSPTTKTALVSGGYQNCIFGVDGQCVPNSKLIE